MSVRYAFAAVCVALAACDLGTTTIPRTASTVVIHGVLNPASLDQLVLVERTLTGSTTVGPRVFNPNDPIASDGGLPVSGASAEIVDSAGNAVTAREDSLGTLRGTGVYRFSFAAPIRHGARYQLFIHTPEGETLSASTRVPNPAILQGTLTRTFNRDHDTLFVQWTPAALTRAYGVRVESPFGPFFLFTDSLSIRMTGQVRDLFSNDLQRLFVPGFTQDMIVAAVDSNFYDYYRTNNDPFTGSGIISRVTGGLGVFGSLVIMTSGALSVVADHTDPMEGAYLATPASAAPAAFTQLTLYVESKAARAGLPDALSGRYSSAGSPARIDGIIGQRLGTTITLAMLENQLAGDTLDVFTGQLQGTTLTGTFRSGTSVVYVKQ